jgi:hypothetical protein
LTRKVAATAVVRATTASARFILLLHKSLVFALIDLNRVGTVSLVIVLLTIAPHQA